MSSKPVTIPYHALHFCVAVAVVLLKKPGNIGLAFGGALQDPDSYMRLVRMQEALDGGRWFGDVVSRDASGAGVVIPWSHLLDGVLLGLRFPLTFFLPAGDALFWAGLIFNALSVGMLGLVCAWAVAPIAKRGWLWIAAFGVAAAAPVIAYAQLGTVTHHIALFTLAVTTWGAAGRAAFGSARWGAAAGLSASAGIWLSPEAMPFGMMGFGAILLSWIVRPSPKVALALSAYGSTFLATIAFALAIDPPHAGYAAPQLDRLSIVFLWLAAIVCALAWLPRGLAYVNLSAFARFAAAGFACVAGAALWLALFPDYFRGLSGLMTPEEAAAFFASMQEMQPIDSRRLYAACALPGVLAIIGALACAVLRKELRPRTLFLYAALCAAACLTLSFQHVRFSSYAAAQAAMMLAVLLSNVRGRWAALARPGLVAVFLAAPPTLAAAFSPAGDASNRREGCSVREAVPLLAPYPSAVVLAHVDDGPELLYRTQMKIVGALYHSGIKGFMRLRAAWDASALDSAPPELRAAEVRYILFCQGPPSAGASQTTLLDRLNNRNPPPWLRLLASDGAAGWLLFQVES